MYREANRQQRELEEDEQIRRDGGKTLEDQYSEMICERIKEESEKKERESSEETLLSLLEETCTKLNTATII